MKLDNSIKSKWIPLFGLFVVASLSGGCERHKWEPEVLAHSSVARDQAVLDHGYEAYKTYCVGCHGESGDGNGPAARFLDPKPRDFRSGVIKFAAVEAGQLPHDADLVRVIREGLHGSSMPSWRLLSDNTLNAVVQYIKTFAAEAYADDEPHVAIVATLDPWEGKAEKAAKKGEGIYHALARCNNCHPAYLTKQEIYDTSKEMFGYGISGFREAMYEGVVTENDWGHETQAPDFLSYTLRNGTEPDSLYTVIVSGIGGTAMPTWSGALPEEHLWALVHYVRSLAEKRGGPESIALRERLANQPPFVKPEPKPAAPAAEDDDEGDQS